VKKTKLKNIKMEEQTTCLSFKEIGNKLDMIIEKVQKLHKKRTKAPKPIKQHV
jgi:hypothetical protein